MFLHFDLFYFSAQFIAKKGFVKVFFNIYIFAISDAQTWNMEYERTWNMESEGEKKLPTSFGLQKCQQEIIFQKWFKLAKI